MEVENDPSWIERIKQKVNSWIQFMSYDLWRLNPDNFSNKKNIFHNILKTIILTVRNIQEQNLAANARSLTYQSILSLVPLLAVLFAIARGFGFENILQSEFFRYTGMEEETKVKIIEFIDNSLKHAQGGVFAGIGIALLLYTIFVLFEQIETGFNQIWQVKESRPLARKLTDYFSLIFLLPVFMLLNSGLNIIVSSSSSYFTDLSYIVGPIVNQLMNVIPYIVIICGLTFIYKFMPNTQVKLVNAFIGGAVAGTAFQIFQLFYLSGQLWITKYNAIYGTFAAIPLLLLWMQLSWFIVLIGAALTYAAQNVRKFSFDKETNRISRRYKDFFTITILSVIVQRFAQEKPALTADQISVLCKVPFRLTNIIIGELEDLELIASTPYLEDKRQLAYQPAVDINLLSVNYLMAKIDSNGSEDFMVDTSDQFAEQWNATLESRMCFYKSQTDTLLRDL